MDCPHCHARLLTKDYEQISVSTCEDCSGIWLDPSQLNQIIAKHDMQFSPEEIQSTLKLAHPGLSDAENASTLPCPVCSDDMHAVNYDYSSGVILHVCSAGHGLWFDKNALEQVQIFMEHWDTEENTHQSELIGKLQKVREDEKAYEDDVARKDDLIRENTESNEAQTKGVLGLSLIKLLDSIFKLFDKMKMDE